MTTINRLRVPWSGSPAVGGGLSTFYWDPTTGGGAADDVVAFFTAIRNYIPVGVTWTVPSSGDAINDINGDLQGTWSAPGTGGVVTSNGTANFAAGVGARAVWTTDGIYRGRRVKGSTFLCPIIASAYPSNATLDDTVVAALAAAAAGLVTANPGFLVYSRAVPDSSPGAGDGTDGESNFVIAGTVPDKVSWLRSRRV